MCHMYTFQVSTCTHNFLSPLYTGAPEGQHSCIPHRPFPSLSNNKTEIDKEICQTVGPEKGDNTFE